MELVEEKLLGDADGRRSWSHVAVHEDDFKNEAIQQRRRPCRTRARVCPVNVLSRRTWPAYEIRRVSSPDAWENRRASTVLHRFPPTLAAAWRLGAVLAAIRAHPPQLNVSKRKRCPAPANEQPGICSSTPRHEQVCERFGRDDDDVEVVSTLRSGLPSCLAPVCSVPYEP